MMGRPMLRAKVLGSMPGAWFGRPLKQIPDGDLWRWYACQAAAREIEAAVRRGQ